MSKQIRFQDQAVSHNTMQWLISGRTHQGGAELDRPEGPVPDLDALRQAVLNMIESRQRVVEGS